MNPETTYVAKGCAGRESPVKTSMKIRITNPKRVERPNMCDIIFYNYFSTIGKNYYCAYKITQDAIYFKFFDSSNGDIHRFKMFPNCGKKEDFNDGDPVTINVTDGKLNELNQFISQFDYPVYFCVSTNEYFIKLEDSKRTRLFNTNNSEETRDMPRVNKNMISIDPNKFSNLCNRTGKSIARISRELGYSDGMLNTSINRGTISVEVANLLEKKFRIRREDYERIVLEEEKPDIKKDISFEFTEDIKSELHKLIYAAVYEAVKKAWSE